MYQLGKKNNFYLGKDCTCCRYNLYSPTVNRVVLDRWHYQYFVVQRGRIDKNTRSSCWSIFLRCTFCTKEERKDLQIDQVDNRHRIALRHSILSLEDSTHKKLLRWCWNIFLRRMVYTREEWKDLRIDQADNCHMNFHRRSILSLKDSTHKKLLQW